MTEIRRPARKRAGLLIDGSGADLGRRLAAGARFVAFAERIFKRYARAAGKALTGALCRLVVVSAGSGTGLDINN